MAWNLLFSTDIGLLSLFTIVFVVGMSIFFARFYAKKMNEEQSKR